MIRFGARFKLRVPMILAPMAGVDGSPSLSLAASNAGAMGSVATVLTPHTELVDRVMARLATADREQMVLVNCWLPLDADLERVLWEARGLDRGRVALSTVFGVLTPNRRKKLQSAGFHSWWATVGTPNEAVAARDAGADVIVLQGAEAGGHRASMLPDIRSASVDAAMALSLWDMLPEVVRAVAPLPVVAAGGIGDGLAMARALSLGAVAVQCGSVFLRSPEADIAPLYDAALASLRGVPGETTVTRVYSGRAGRAVARSAKAALAAAPKPLVGYPAQRNVMRSLGVAPHWAGVEAHRARALPVAQIIDAMWAECRAALARSKE